MHVFSLGYCFTILSPVPNIIGFIPSILNLLFISSVFFPIYESIVYDLICDSFISVPFRFKYFVILSVTSRIAAVRATLPPQTGF